MSVPIPSVDLSPPDAGGALDGWGQREAVTPQIHTIHSSNPRTVEAAASESPPPVEPRSDAELLAAFVQRRDADAFTEIVQRYRHLVYRVALRAVEDRHLADDVFQATFLVLAQSAHKIKSGDVLAAWLHGTARNISRRALVNQHAEQKQLKDWAKQTLAQKGEEMATSTDADPFEELARRNEQQLLDEELQQLPEASRAPLVLFYLERKSQAEIAQIMGLSVEAVEGRLKRAKQELRTRLIRRGVLLSTVVAAATVLTPSITFAAPAASLVSATVTTALGTAALGSTALGATAVTGAATSSKLAAGSVSASTLAAQEIALMSATSKATAMLITTAASTTLISGLVLGAMVGTFSMGAGGDRLSMADLAMPQEINGETLGPNLLSSEIDDLVQIALVEPEEMKESEKAASVRAEKVETPNEVKPTVYPVADLSAEQLVKAAEYAVPLAADISLHETTQSLVIRATQENHKQIAKQLTALRSQYSPWMSDQFKLVLARGRLAKSLKEFGENHSKVKELRSKIAAIEKAIAEGTNQSRIVEEQEELLDSPLVTTAPEVKENNSEQSTAQTEKVDEHSNELKPVAYQVGDLTADELKDMDDYAQSIGLTVLLHHTTQSFVVRATDENHRKLSAHFVEIRQKHDAKASVQFELFSARAKLAKLLKEFDENHPDVKQARNEIATIEKSIAEGTTSPQVVDEQKEMSDAADAASDADVKAAKGTESFNDLTVVTYSLEGLFVDSHQDATLFAESTSDSATYHASTNSLVVRDTRENHRKISGYLSQLWRRQKAESELYIELQAAKRTRLDAIKKHGKDHDSVREARARIDAVLTENAKLGQDSQPKEMIQISTMLFEADHETIRQFATEGDEGFILKPESRRQFRSLAEKKQLRVVSEMSMICQVGQPNRIVSGGVFSLESGPKDSDWDNQELESVVYGTINQIDVLDKKGSDGQRVLKYELEYSANDDRNAPLYDGRKLPVIHGHVIRGYTLLPDPKSEGVLIGPVGPVERTSAEGVARKVSTYLWIQSDEARLVPLGGSQ